VKARSIPLQRHALLTRLAVSPHLNPGPHPNVMPLIDCGYDRPTGRFIIVTEWMDGLSLRDHIRIQTNPVPEQVDALMTKTTA
jgi:serine/threonine protein kinase